VPAADPTSAAEPAAVGSLEHALGLAFGHLARRDRTEAEMRAHLERRGVEPTEVDAALTTLREQGYLDDARFAQRFAEDRRGLDAWGSERIERRLRELGVDREHVAAAIAGQSGEEELEAAIGLLARRFPHPPEEPRDLDRALGMLVRKGYELELVHDAIRAHARRVAEA
jgi:regulatory protein